MKSSQTGRWACICAVALCLMLALAKVSVAQPQPDPTIHTVHVAVVVSDMARSMDFYQQVMGLHKVDRYDLDSDFGRRSGLTGGVPFVVEVLASACARAECSAARTHWRDNQGTCRQSRNVDKSASSHRD